MSLILDVFLSLKNMRRMTYNWEFYYFIFYTQQKLCIQNHGKNEVKLTFLGNVATWNIAREIFLANQTLFLVAMKEVLQYSWKLLFTVYEHVKTNMFSWNSLKACPFWITHLLVFVNVCM